MIKKDKKLSKLLNKLNKVEKEIQDWFDLNIKDRLENCKSKEEVNSICKEIYYQCSGDNGEVRDMPGLILVPLAVKMSLFI